MGVNCCMTGAQDWELDAALSVTWMDVSLSRWEPTALREMAIGDGCLHGSNREIRLWLGGCIGMPVCVFVLHWLCA